MRPPIFVSDQEYRMHLDDVDFWWPYIAETLKRHNLGDIGHEPTAGMGGTYPTFLYGDVVVKLFGHLRLWRRSHVGERAALTLLATDPEIAAPRLLAQGQLYDAPDPSWPYLIMTRMSGIPWQYNELSGDQRRSVAAELGRQIRRVHALSSPGNAPHEDRVVPNVVAAAAQSSLPPHLLAQIENYLARLGPLARVFVHGDLMYRHVFVAHGQLSGIIDWGDAIVSDRHYELAKLHLDLFNCDKTLLQIFLETSDWPLTKDFPHQSLEYALYRQAHGLAQHMTMDVFYTLPALFPLQEIGTLDELAVELFAL